MERLAARAPPASTDQALTALAQSLNHAMDMEARTLCRSDGWERNGSERRKLTVAGMTVVVEVPRLRRLDGTTEEHRSVPLAERLGRPELSVSEVIGEGASVRGTGRLLSLLAPGAVLSRSAIHERDRKHAQTALEQLQSRRLDGENFVAVMIDAKALGERRARKRSVLVALGVTVDGRKLALGVQEAAAESEDLARRLVDRLLENGLDPGVLWIADGQKHFWSAIRAAYEQRPEQPLIQSCVLHHWRKVEKRIREADREHPLERRMPEELRDELRRRMYAAWARDDAREARSLLEQLAAELRAQSYAGAAESLHNQLDETLTLIRLGVDRDTRRALQSTNAIESVMNVIRRQTQSITRWNNDDMRLRWVARAVLRGEQRWSRLADPSGLVPLWKRFHPQSAEPAAWVSRLPPTVRVSDLRVPAEGSTAARALAEMELPAAELESARSQWLGAREALEQLGLEHGTPVTTDALSSALQGLNLRTGTHVRTELTRKGVGPDRLLTVRLNPSRQLARRWREGDAKGRDRIEQALLDSAERALARLTEPDAGDRKVAAAAMVRVLQGSDGQPQISVKAVVVGALQGQDKLVSPVTKLAKERRTRRWAADAARDALAATLDPKAPVREQASEAAPRARRKADLLQVNRRYLSDDDFEALKTSVAQLQQDYRGLGAVTLATVRDSLGDPFGKLRASAAATLNVTKRYATKAAIRKQLPEGGKEAARLDRELVALAAELRALRARRRHIDQWLEDWGDRAAKLVTVERVAAEQGMDLDAPEVRAFVEHGRRMRATMLRDYEGLLGPTRCRQLLRRAGELAADYPDMSDADLACDLQAVGTPLEAIDQRLHRLLGRTRESKDRRQQSPPDRSPHQQQPRHPSPREKLLDSSMALYGEAAAQWLALMGEFLSRDDARVAAAREAAQRAVATREAVAAEVCASKAPEQAPPERAPDELAVGIG